MLLRRRGLRLAGRRHHPSLNAELAQTEALIGLELDHGTGEERQAFPAGMLE